MIHNDAQYASSRKILEQLKQALEITSKTNVEAWIKQAQINALTSQIADVEREIGEYDGKKT